MQLHEVAIGNDVLRSDLLPVEHLRAPGAGELQASRTVNGFSFSAGLPGVLV